LKALTRALREQVRTDECESISFFNIMREMR
jgi:hypothetical protein